jgi:hypothetical protein
MKASRSQSGKSSPRGYGRAPRAVGLLVRQLEGVGAAPIRTDHESGTARGYSLCLDAEDEVLYADHVCSRCRVWNSW